MYQMCSGITKMVECLASLSPSERATLQIFKIRSSLCTSTPNSFIRITAMAYVIYSSLMLHLLYRQPLATKCVIIILCDIR